VSQKANSRRESIVGDLLASKEGRDSHPSSFPWRRIRWVPAEKKAASELGDGGKIQAEVFLPSKEQYEAWKAEQKKWDADWEAGLKAGKTPADMFGIIGRALMRGLSVPFPHERLGGAWHHVEIRMDGDGYRKLATLERGHVHVLFDQLTKVPFLSRKLRLDKEGRQKPRGTHSVFSQTIWFHCRYWAPRFLEWALTGAMMDDSLYKETKESLKARGYNRLTPERVASTLTQLIIENGIKTTPKKYLPPKYKLPRFEPPSQFFDSVGKDNRFLQRILRLMKKELRPTHPPRSGVFFPPQPWEKVIPQILEGSYPPILGEFELANSFLLKNFLRSETRPGLYRLI